MPERLSDKLRDFLKTCEGRDVDLNYLRRELHIDPNSPADTNLRTLMSVNLAKERIVKPSGRKDGIYKVIKPVEPVKWWEAENSEPLNFLFPRSHEDLSEFGIEDIVEVFAGDFILISGVSNFGKTTIACNILGENLELMQSYLMGSEYTASDGKISPKFKRRMDRMKWVDWMKDGKPRFQLYPVGSDYEDYIQSDAMNIIDWISLPGEYYMIDYVMKTIKDRIGRGIGVGVLQKNKDNPNPEGGERAERYADIHLKIDPYGNESMLTLGKVKAPKGKATGRMWAFEIVDFGANILHIREIVRCNKCWGKGYLRSGQNNVRCDNCKGLKYIDK